MDVRLCRSPFLRSVAGSAVVVCLTLGAVVPVAASTGNAGAQAASAGEQAADKAVSTLATHGAGATIAERADVIVALGTAAIGWRIV